MVHKTLQAGLGRLTQGTFRAITLAAVLLLGSGQAAGPNPEQPFETGVANPGNLLDTPVIAALQAKGIEPAHPCSDAVFLRRVYLDVIGTLPSPKEVQAFLQDERPEKRALLIDHLLDREEFAQYWALKWCDVLRVKAEFPINLWPNAVQAYHRWVYDAIRRNMPYDEFARALLTSSGSNFREPPVNFYRAIQGREPSAIAGAVALTFMGTRLETWPEAERAGMVAFFSRVAYKKTGEWKEEIVYLNPEALDPLAAEFPGGNEVKIPAGTDPRVIFADWLLAKDNPWFARNAVNRIWAWLFGRGIVHEADDFRPDNPPSSPELLALLEQELVAADYDLRHIYRLILNSRTYQQSSIPRSADPDAERLFAYYPVRRLDAEVLIDALCWIGGAGEGYESAIPEPYTEIPDTQRTIALADGSISSPFLEMFGRPTRDTGLLSERNNQPSDGQRLHLLNSTHVQKKIENSGRLRQLVRDSKGDFRRVAGGLYLGILSRRPTPAEMTNVLEYRKTSGLTPAQAAADVAWALVNSKEFLYRH